MKIILIRADRIGDQILFLPFLQSLARQCPQATVVLAVPADVRPLYKLSRLPLEILPFDRERLHADPGYCRDVAQQAGGETFDWLILPAFNLDKATLKLARRIPAKRRISFRGEMRGVRPWHRWLHLRGISEKISLDDPDLHELEKYRRLLGYLGLAPEIQPPRLSPPLIFPGLDKPRERGFAGTPSRRLRIVLAVGTVNRIKEYPHWAEVVSEVDKNLHPDWILIGGPGESIPPSLRQKMDGKTTTDLVGKTTLENLMMEIAGADLFLGVDTGPAHLALALQKPAVVVLGGGDYGRFFPYGHARVVTHRMDCFQCHWDCRYDRALCLHDLPPQEVVRSVLAALGMVPFETP